MVRHAGRSRPSFDSYTFVSVAQGRDPSILRRPSRPYPDRPLLLGFSFAGAAPCTERPVDLAEQIRRSGSPAGTRQASSGPIAPLAFGSNTPHASRCTNALQPAQDPVQV